MVPGGEMDVVAKEEATWRAGRSWLGVHPLPTQVTCKSGSGGTHLLWDNNSRFRAKEARGWMLYRILSAPIAALKSNVTPSIYKCDNDRAGG